MNYNDDEIQFLGGEDIQNSPTSVPRKPASRRWWTAVAALAIVVLAATTFYFWRQANRFTVSFEYPLSRSSAQIISNLEAMQGDSVHGVTMKEDSLYGVGMRLFAALCRLFRAPHRQTAIQRYALPPTHGTIIGTTTSNTDT